MPNAREAPALRCELSVSRRLVLLVSAAHLGALAIASTLAFEEVAYAALGAAVLASWAWTLLRRLLRAAPDACMAIELGGERDIVLCLRDGRRIRGELTAASRVLPWMIVLDVALEGRRRAARIVVLPDSVTGDGHRRLRARLRWTRYQGGEADTAGGSL